MNLSLKHVLTAACSLMLGLTAAPAAAQTYTEDFEADFPSWETEWFNIYSDAQNYYGVGEDRGNNPDGLWVVSDGCTPATCSNSPVTVTFEAGFAASLSSFYMDIAGYRESTLTIFDAFGATLFTSDVVLTLGATTDPGVYVRYGTTSTSGIGGFSFSGQAGGNNSIDNLEAITGAVPEPSTWAMMLIGFGGIGYSMRRRRTSIAIARHA